MALKKRCMYCILEEDFIEDVPDEDDYISSVEVHRSMIDEFEEIGVPRCSCRKILNEAPRIYEKIRLKANEIFYRTGARITEDEYAEAMNTAIAEEPKITSVCCKGMIESLPRITEPPNPFIPRYIEDQEELLQAERTARYGNIILRRFNPEPYNPYTYKLDRLVSPTEDEQDREDFELKALQSESNVIKTTVTVEKYPGMPPFEDNDEFEEESPDLFATVKGKYIVYGIASTGIKGYEVPVIRSTQISAR